MSSISLVHVSKTFPNGVNALRDVTLDVANGERLALVGPSGSGKSTLLRIIAGLENSDSGRVLVNGADVRNVPPHLRGVGMLTQRPALYPHLTMNEQIGTEDREILDVLRLHALRDRLPHQLSGGERQRVALAKLLTSGRGIWLLDEPFSGLDRMFRLEFRHDLHLLLARSAATMILVTHDPTDALALGCRVAVLGGGTIQQIGSPDELTARPNTRFVAACLGRWNLIDGRVQDGMGGGDLSEPRFVSECGAVSVNLPADFVCRIRPTRTQSLTLGFRPEDVFTEPAPLSATDAIAVKLEGWTVVSAEPVGSGWMLTVARGPTPVRMWLSSGSPPPVGHPINWCVSADRCLYFGSPEGNRIVLDEFKVQSSRSEPDRV